jgi:acetyl esterase/lipase
MKEFFLFTLITVCFFTACSKDNNTTESAIPVIETVAITEITTTSAVSGGNVTDDGGETIISRGVCWSSSRNPTIEDQRLEDNGQSVSFTVVIAGLTPATTYYVRAYATNSNGTAYGVERSFTTRSEGGSNMGDPSQTQIYLWHEGKMAATTSYQTVANSGNPDGPDFRPYMVRFPPAEGVTVKGAVFICAGGAFQFRSDAMEGTGVARALSALGYHCFVVNYRLRPYTQQEGALDLARAVRFVRFHAGYYGINEDDIAVMGFSAGGILCGEMVLHWKGTVNGSSLDNSYTPDELDNVSADASAIGHIYSFYGRLSVASTDVDLFRRSNLPPAYFCYGTQDPFVSQFAACVNALRQAEVPVETNILEGAPHGYGYTRGWIPAFDNWLTNIFDN